MKLNQLLEVNQPTGMKSSLDDLVMPLVIYAVERAADERHARNILDSIHGVTMKRLEEEFDKLHAAAARRKELD